jgi:GxxExxY protein
MDDKLLHKDLTFQVIGAAMEVHRVLGRGFLESVYHKALAHEFVLRGLGFEHHVQLPVNYKGVDAGVFQADFVIDKKVIIEIKSVSQIVQAHRAQAMHYLQATGLPLALILNFGTASLQHERIILTPKARNLP